MPPDPRDDEYGDALVHWVEHFVRMTHGKAFVLFTNGKLMRDVAAELEPVFDDLGIRALVQGTAPTRRDAEEFKRDTDSVLFGLDSFWQGVDVPGEALSNVIITRRPLPYRTIRSSRPAWNLSRPAVAMRLWNLTCPRRF